MRCHSKWELTFIGVVIQVMLREPLAMTDRFPTFEMVLKKRGRKWTWCVRSTEGVVIMQGSEASRAAAKYQADRALFLLLLTAPYRLRRPSGLDVMASQGRFAS
jgi:hypothetical protein